MAVDIGPKIGIDGEKEFRQNLQNINQQLRTLGSEMKAVTSSFDAGDKSEKALAAQTDVLNRQIDAQKQKLSELQKGLEAAEGKYGKTDSRTLKWAQAVNDATTELNRMESELRGLNGGLDNTADKLDEAGDASDGLGGKFSALTVAAGDLISSGIEAMISAVGDLVSSFWNMDAASEEFRTALGRVNTAFSTSQVGAEGAEDVFRGFYQILGDTDTAAEASQLLSRLATSSEDAAEWINIAAGVSGTFGDSLPIESLIEAANETANVGTVTGTLADALNWVGISEDDFNAALESCSSTSERQALIMETLAGTYDEAADSFYDTNAVLVQTRDNQYALNAAMATLGGTVAQLKSEMLSEFIPSLQAAATAFNGILTGAAGADQQLATAISQMVQTGAAMLPSFLQLGGQILSALLSGIVQALPTIAATVSQLGTQRRTYGTGIPPPVLRAGLDLLNNVAVGIGNALPNVLQAVGEVLTGIFEYLTENGPSLLEHGAQILINLANGIIEAIPELVSQFSQVLVSITDYLRENLPEIAKQGARVVTELGVGIIKQIPALVAQLPELINAVFGALGEMASLALDVGLGIVQGIWEGIKNAAEWLVDKLAGWAGDILDSVKDFFGINSPSTVFRDEVGVQLGRGVAEGLDDSLTYVTQAAERIGSAVEAKILETQEALEQAQTDMVKETLNTQLEALETFRDEYTDALEDLQKRQESMADKLSGYGDLFAWTEKGDGEILELGDLREQIDAINAYSTALEALKDRGASDTLMEEIVGLNIDDATAYTNRLLQMTDDEYATYMQLWEEKQRAAAEIAKTFYSDELRNLESEFVDKLPESLDSLKDEMAELGANCALGLADGFESESSAISNAFVSATEKALAEAEQAMGVHSPSTVWAGFGRNLALGLDSGFTSAMEGVSSRMAEAVQLPTIDTINNAAAGMVNGMAAISGSQRITVEVPVYIDGKELYRATLDDLRAVQKANPEVARA